MVKVFYNGNIVYSKGGYKGEDKETIKQKGNKQKTYYLQYKHYRQISSCLSYSYMHRKNNLVFLTFTIQDNITDNRITNPAFSYLLRRMKQSKKFQLHSFVWVAERQKRGAIHYHTILDLPKFDYNDLKKLWHETGKKFNIEISLKNSVSGSKKWTKTKTGKWKYQSSVVDNVEKAVKYVTKYISKGIGGQNNQKFEGRCYAISQNINVKPMEIDHKTALNYANTQTRTPYEAEHVTVLFADVKAVAEDWNQLKQEAKRVKTDKIKRKINAISEGGTRNEYKKREVADFRFLQKYPEFQTLSDMEKIISRLEPKQKTISFVT